MITVVIILHVAIVFLFLKLTSVSIVQIANTLFRNLTVKFLLQNYLGQSGERVHIFTWVDSFLQDQLELLVVWTEST